MSIVDAGLDASVLAPYALLTGSGQIDGNFIAAQIDITGEAHNVEFDRNSSADRSRPESEDQPSSGAEHVSNDGNWCSIYGCRDAAKEVEPVALFTNKRPRLPARAFSCQECERPLAPVVLRALLIGEDSVEVLGLLDEDVGLLAWAGAAARPAAGRAPASQGTCR